MMQDETGRHILQYLQYTPIHNVNMIYEPYTYVPVYAEPNQESELIQLI